MPAILEKRAEERTLARDPFTMMDRMRDEFDRLFEGFGLNRLHWPALPALAWRTDGPWMPAIEVLERRGTMVIKADLPGLTRSDITVEVTPEGVTLRGERKSEVTEERREEGYYRSERMYGHFSRFVPLPEGADTTKANAHFKDGVLEVDVPVPRLEKAAPKTLPIG